MKSPKIWFAEGRIFLQTDTGKQASLPLKAFPRLYNATKTQREAYSFSPLGIHWQEIDEDLSFEGFFYEPVNESNVIARLFSSFPEINVNQFARMMGINQSLMAKYICGVSTPSEARKQQIETALRRLGHELSAVTL